MAGPTSDELEKHPPIGEHDPVPRLPRPRRWGFPPGQLIRIAMFASLLAGVVMLREPCSAGVGSFVNAFEEPTDAGAAKAVAPKSDRVDFVRIGVDDDPATVRRKIDQIRGIFRDAGSAEPPESSSPPPSPDE